MTEVAPVLGVLAVLVGPRRHDPLRPRHAARGDAAAPRHVADLERARDRGVLLPARRRRVLEPARPAAQAILTSLVFILAIRRGEGGVSARDRVVIAIAGGGVLGWIIADEPIVATACVVAADLVAAALMIPKTYRDPDSETLATYALASLSGLLAAGAVGTLDMALLLYPVYFALVNGAIAHAHPPATRVLRRAPARRRVLRHVTGEMTASAAIIKRWSAGCRVRSSSAAPGSWRRSTRRSRRRVGARRRPSW